jgi:hypothetical protein
VTGDSDDEVDGACDASLAAARGEEETEPKAATVA